MSPSMSTTDGCGELLSTAFRPIQHLQRRRQQQKGGGTKAIRGGRRRAPRAEARKRLKAASYAKAPKQTVEHRVGDTRRAKENSWSASIFLSNQRKEPLESASAWKKFNGGGRIKTEIPVFSNCGASLSEGFDETFGTDDWRAGFMAEQDNGPVTHASRS